MNTTALSTHRFEALEQMADNLREWDILFRPMARDTSVTELTQVQLGPIMITHLSTGCRHVHEGASPSDAYTFGLLADHDQNVRWCGSSLDVTQIPFFSPSQDFTASASPKFDVYTLSVNPDWLQRTAAWEHLHGTSGAQSGQRRLLLRPDSTAISCLRNTLSETCGLLTNTSCGSTLSTKAFSSVASDVMSGLIEVLSDAAPVLETVPAAARARAVRVAISYMLDRTEETLSIDEVARAAMVSGRTLRRAFLEHFGATPKVYYLGLRLNRVRTELLRHTPSELLICDAASKWGFWHMGQFAKDYRRLFGELPSQTLKRTN